MENIEKYSENLLESWVSILSILKKSKITKKLTYNESIVMLCVYKKYYEEKKHTSIKEIQNYTRITKSLINRTINSLIEKGLLLRVDSIGDGRVSYVDLVEEKLDIFLEVHNESIGIAKKIIDVIGIENTKSFIDSINKIEKEKILK